MARQLLPLPQKKFKKSMTMKKILLYTTLALAISLAWACNSSKRWSHEERVEIRKMLADYRMMEYLNSLNDAEFILFSDGVSTTLEESFPSYTTFIVMPALNDTISEYIVTSIVDEIEADATNMKHLFPYHELVNNKILPAKLDHPERHAFYSCMAGKINTAYPDLSIFLNDMIGGDSTCKANIRKFERECTSDLFDWTISEDVEVITEI